MSMHDAETRVRRMVKVALDCMAVAILIAIATVAHGQTIIDPHEECAAGASCYYALLPTVTK